MSLYGKYRPQNFANLVGQDHIRETILHEILAGTLTHAYLFAGPRGTGKTSTARLIAKALNCEKKSASAQREREGESRLGPVGSQPSEPERTNKAGEPCEECDFCKTITEGSLIDVIEIDAASNRGIDEIRDLKEKIQFAPTRAKTKTYIIDEVHMLTKEAFNALLKTLEEPPENVYFILCTTEIHKIPETIISRCQRFDFKRIDVKTIMTRLSYIAQRENIEAEDQAIELIARHVEGGLRDAIGLLEQMAISGKLLAEYVRSHLGITGHTTIDQLLELLEHKEMQRAIQLVNEVHNEGYDLTSFVREILECLRQRLINGIQNEKKDQTKWLPMIERFEEARDMLRGTVIPQLPIEIAVIKICGDSVVSAQIQPEEKKADAPGGGIDSLASLTLGPPEETAKAEAQEQQLASALKQGVEMERYQGNLAEAWPRVLEHVQPPSLRRSLTDAKISESEDAKITLTFGSRFHMEKVNVAENRAKVEKAIHHLSGKAVKVTCELALLNAGAEKPTPAVTLPPQPKKIVKKNMTERAMEIFGEE